MKNRDLKMLFYKYCKEKTYVPSVFEDEIWDYLMSTVGVYIDGNSLWKNFCNIASTVYDNNIIKMENDIITIGNKISALFYEKYKKHRDVNFINHSLKHIKRFNNIPNGTYLSMDLTNGYTQSMIHYGVLKQNEIDDIFNEYQNSQILKTCKWIFSYAYNKLGNKNIAPILCKNLLYETIYVDDPLLNQLEKNFFMSGDRLLIKIDEADIDLYKQHIGNKYVCTNGVSFFIDICFKTSIKKDGFPEIHIDNTINSTKHFASNAYFHTLNYDIYPQVYKYIIGQPLEKYDLSYGFDDMVYFYDKKIWSSY